jgi:hypothetical protein
MAKWKYPAALLAQLNHNAITLKKHLRPGKKRVQQEGSREWKLRSAFSILLNVSLFDLSMLLYNLTADLNQ